MASYEDVTKNLADRVGELTHFAQIALFTSVGDALFPLYKAFVSDQGWDDQGIVPRIAGYLHSSLEGEFLKRPTGNRAAADLVILLDGVTPHVDDFRGNSVFNAIASIGSYDAALRIAAGHVVYPDWIDYALDPLQVDILRKKYDMVAPGGSDEDTKIMNKVYRGLRMRKAVTSIEESINILRKNDIDRTTLTEVVGLLSALRP